MKNRSFLTVLKSLRLTDFILLAVAGVVNAVGVTLLLSPAGLYDGGFSGTSMLLGKVTPLAMSAYLIILNVPFFLFGLKRLGASFIVHSLFAVGVYSLFSYLFQSVFPIDFPTGRPSRVPICCSARSSAELYPAWAAALPYARAAR